MIVRFVPALALGALLATSPALARGGVTPGLVLAAKGTRAVSTQAKAARERGERDFTDRTARMASIMGPELSRAAPLNVPLRPVWNRPVRRDADAAAGLR